MDETQRITKSQGKLMIAVAILFDAIPVLLIMVLLMFGMYQVSKIDGVDVLVEDVQKMNSSGDIRNSDLSWWQKIKAHMGVMGAVGRTAKTAATGGLKVIAGAAAALIFIPFIYVGASFMSTITAYLLFTVWFFFKRVNMWSISKPQRFLVNMGTAVIENVPIVDLLPGTTFMVWRHVKLTQIEDTQKQQEVERKNKKLLEQRMRSGMADDYRMARVA